MVLLTSTEVGMIMWLDLVTCQENTGWVSFIIIILKIMHIFHFIFLNCNKRLIFLTDGKARIIILSENSADKLNH